LGREHVPCNVHLIQSDRDLPSIFSHATLQRPCHHDVGLS
jgi:hypothetical protein